MTPPAAETSGRCSALTRAMPRNAARPALMRWPRPLRHACLALSALGICLPSSGLSAQLPAETEDRLRGIYERGEFGARGFDGEWLPDGSGYVRMEPSEGSSVPELVRYAPATGERSVLVSVDALQPAGAPGPLRIDAYALSEDASLALIRVRSTASGAGPFEYWTLDRPSGRLRKIAEGVQGGSMEDRIAPGGGRILFERGGDLHVTDAAGARTVRLTTDGAPDSVRNARARWSPDGESIVFVREEVSEIPFRAMLEPVDPTYPAVRETRYARIGGPIPALRVGVARADEGDVRWIDLPEDPEGFYLGEVDWAASDEEVLVEKLSRGRDQRELFLANAATGNVRRIYTERDPAWVVASYQINLGVDWVRDGEAFVLFSERSGWRRAYLHDRNGGELAALTPDGVDVIDKGWVDRSEGRLYYYASPENATQRYLYRVPIDGPGDGPGGGSGDVPSDRSGDVPGDGDGSGGRPDGGPDVGPGDGSGAERAGGPGGGLGEPERVTPAGPSGWHAYRTSPDGRWAFHTHSAFTRPPAVELVRLPTHETVRALEDNEGLRSRVTPLLEDNQEFLQLSIGEGLTMDAWMIRPSDFDPERSYPLFVYVYGEPHAQTVLDQWSGNQLYHQTIADLGYVVVSIDNRGTPAPKGAAWRRAVFGSLGPLSTEEQAAAVRELARTHPYIDVSRVGVWGWSGGGSNTLNALFRRPDVFHVGIAVVPKPQAHLYNAWFQEIYMRTVEENPEGYRNASAINFAEGLEGELLIVTGTGETNTHVQIVEGLVDRLVALGKHFHYMPYPNRNHGISEGEGTSVHLRMLMVRFLLEHLRAGPA